LDLPRLPLFVFLAPPQLDVRARAPRDDWLIAKETPD
jgi:hypothetical protein